MRVRRLMWLFVVLALALAGCAATRQAPVLDRLPPSSAAKAGSPPSARAAPLPPETRPGYYTVRKGDTLYSIALDHGLDYRELADWNHIDPTRIFVGQQLRLTAPPGTVTVAPLKSSPHAVEARPLSGSAMPENDAVKSQPQGVRVPYSNRVYAQMAAIKPAPEAAAGPESPRESDGIEWTWPAAGTILGGFSESGKLKGITISGKLGQPVLASAAGRVIFSGTGVRGFGKLIVIKHNDTYLSVYAHNDKLLVKEGQTVSRGQKIAEMGNSDADAVMLHFEIRRFGKPVDPVGLLPERKA